MLGKDLIMALAKEQQLDLLVLVVQLSLELAELSILLPEGLAQCIIMVLEVGALIPHLFVYLHILQLDISLHWPAEGLPRHLLMHLDTQLLVISNHLLQFKLSRGQSLSHIVDRLELLCLLIAKGEQVISLSDKDVNH